MQPRDELILKHIGLYYASIRVAIERLFFEGKSCDDVIRRLKEEKVLDVGYVDRVAYYFLTAGTARRLNMKHRAKPPGPRALKRALSVLWFCCMTETRRYRIERSTLVKLFGKHESLRLGIPHCWERLDEQRKLIYRLYTPGPNTETADIVNTLRLDAAEALAYSTLAPYILSQFYGFVVLVETPERRTHIEAALRAGSSPALFIKIEVVPSIQTLGSAIRSIKNQEILL